MDTNPVRLGWPTRVVAAMLGTLLVVGGVYGVVLMAQAAREGRSDDLLWHANGLGCLALGLLMLHAARTGRDGLRAWLDRIIPQA